MKSGLYFDRTDNCFYVWAKEGEYSMREKIDTPKRRASVEPRLRQQVRNWRRTGRRVLAS